MAGSASSGIRHLDCQLVQLLTNPLDTSTATIMGSLATE